MQGGTRACDRGPAQAVLARRAGFGYRFAAMQGQGSSSGGGEDGARNAYCDVLGIPVPSVEAVKDHREANTFALLITALLERGEPMTLPEVARRLAQASVGAEQDVLRSLKRCRPARAPVHREDDYYALDPHDDDLDLWTFRIGLRRARVPRMHVVRPDPSEELPGPDVALTHEEIREAFEGEHLGGWSVHRLALAVLDCHGLRMRGEDAIAHLERLGMPRRLTERTSGHWRQHAIRVGDDGTWSVDEDHPDLRSAREAVRKRIATNRRWQAQRPSPAVIEAQKRRAEELEEQRRAELARMRRGLVCAAPAKQPEAITVVDVAARELRTFFAGDFEAARAELAAYDFIGAIDVRPLLRRLGFDPGERRLAELGPPQKTRQLNRRGRTLRITAELIVRGSCGISKPFGDEATYQRYLEHGQTTRLRRRLESDAKSLCALYEYGMLHGAVRLRWGFVDEMLRAPWVDRREPTLYDLERQSLERGVPLEVVVGSAPGWADPWSRAQLAFVQEPTYWGSRQLLGERGPIDRDEVQRARLAE